MRITFLLVILFGVAGAATATQPPITALAFAPDGEEVAACSQAGLAIYSWPELKLTRTVETTAANLHCLRFSPDGKLLALGGGDPAENGTVQLFAWPGCESRGSLGNHSDSIRSLEWIDDSTLVTASVDRDIKLWKVAEPKKPLHTLRGHSRGVHALCLLPGGDVLVSASGDQSLRVWNLPEQKLVRSLNQHTKAVNGLALRPASEGLPMVASASSDRTIRFWQPTIGRMVRYIRLEAEPLSIAWLPAGEHLAAACVDGKVRLIHADEVTVVKTIDAIDGWAYALAVHPTKNEVAIGGAAGQIRRIVFEDLE